MDISVNFDETILVSAFFEALDNLNDIEQTRKDFIEDGPDTFKELKWLKEMLVEAAEQSLDIDL